MSIKYSEAITKRAKAHKKRVYNKLLVRMIYWLYIRPVEHQVKADMRKISIKLPFAQDTSDDGTRAVDSWKSELTTDDGCRWSFIGKTNGARIFYRIVYANHISGT